MTIIKTFSAANTNTEPTSLDDCICEVLGHSVHGCCIPCKARSARELESLALTEEANAKACEILHGSCPADLAEAMQRARRLRQIAAKMRAAVR